MTEEPPMQIDQLPFSVPPERLEAIQSVLDAAATAHAELDAKEKQALLGVHELFHSMRARTRLDMIALAESLLVELKH